MGSQRLGDHTYLQAPVGRCSPSLRSTGQPSRPVRAGGGEVGQGRGILAWPPATPFGSVLPKVDVGADASYLYASS